MLFRSIVMTRILEHCGERAWSIVIKGDKEHCDDMGRELCDYSGHGVLGQKVSWNIVLRGITVLFGKRGLGAL